ncbi:MAG TPA: hypothetical protein PK093_03085 [Phycisphaerae bacterium]|nr:hypothetical protein [Phycisphaerae bacterium]
MTDASEKLAIDCACGIHFLVPTTARGRSVLCPECGVSNRVPAETTDVPASPTAPVPVPQTLKSFGAGRLCPNCTDSLASDVIVCKRCGFNTVTGELAPAAARPAIEEIVEEADRDPEPLIHREVISTERGYWLLGFALAAVGASLGGAIWYLIGVAFKAESPWIGIVTGGLAGAGAAVANKGRSNSLRIASACLAIAAIVASRYFVFLMLPRQSYRTSDGFRPMRFGDLFSASDSLWILLTVCAAMGVAGFGRRYQV